MHPDAHDDHPAARALPFADADLALLWAGLVALRERLPAADPARARIARLLGRLADEQRGRHSPAPAHATLAAG